jgi:integrase
MYPYTFPVDLPWTYGHAGLLLGFYGVSPYIHRTGFTEWEHMHAKITTRLVASLSPQAEPYEVTDTELRGFRLRVQPSGHMSYYLVYRTVSSQKKRVRIGPADALSVAQARDLALRYAAQAITGDDPQVAKQQAREAAQRAQLQTLGGFLDAKYAPWVLAERKSGAATLARLRHNFADLLERSMQEISPWVIEKWRAEQLKCGKQKSTVNRDITGLKSVLAKAVAWGILPSHPLAKLKPIKLDTKGRVRYLTEAEELRLRTALTSRDERIKAARARANAWRRVRRYAEMPSIEIQAYGDRLTPMVLLTLNTGLRRGGLFNLRWEDANVQAKVLTVEGATAKSGQTRHLPLNREALAVLETWRQQSPGEGFVFPGKGGQRLNNTRKAWKRLLQEADITGFTWHDLRHSFASKLVMAGVSLAVVRELLGHADLTMTLRYAHLAPDHKANAVEKLCPSPIEKSALVLQSAQLQPLQTLLRLKTAKS